MQIPYETIISLMRGMKELKKVSKFSKYFRNREINKLIKLLEDTKKFDNTICKKDLINFYVFLQDVSMIVGEQLVELTNSRHNVYLYNVDNVNFGLRFVEKIHSYIVTVDIKTCDTFETRNAYVDIHKEVLDDTEAQKVLESISYQTTFLTAHKDRLVDENFVYNLMIKTIIKYLNYFKEVY